MDALDRLVERTKRQLDMAQGFYQEYRNQQYLVQIVESGAVEDGTRSMADVMILAELGWIGDKDGRWQVTETGMKEYKRLKSIFE